MAGSCEWNNKPLGFIKCGEFCDYLRDLASDEEHCAKEFCCPCFTNPSVFHLF